MPARKRTREETDSEDSIPEPGEELSTLSRIRGMWEFAALMQYLFFFGKAVKVEDLDVEEFEDECLKPGHSARLSQMALALLKNVSSHKGLTPDLLDEYTRRQYVAKAPARNPFGEDDIPRKFEDLDIFTKIRVLQQLATWTLNNPNPIREKLDEPESKQMRWRIEPDGWDKEGRIYFILDDNRLYRRTDAPPPSDRPPVTPKKSKSRKSNGRATRSAKRKRVGRKVIETSPEETEDEVRDAGVFNATKEKATADEFCMQRWELVAVTKDDYEVFIDSMRKSRDLDEKALVKELQERVLPILEEQEEQRKRKEAKRMKELELMQKIATSKRSSRLADKQDRVKQELEAAEAERQRQSELAMARREQRKQEELEHARESRRETREQRLRDREVKRILEEERLAQEQEMLKKIEAEGIVVDPSRGRISERQLKADMEKRKQELENLQQDDTWYFDCVCGKHGSNLDDGTHSIACEKCNTWQHSKCNGIDQAQAERDDFHFECGDCKKKAANGNFKLKLKVSPSEAAVEPLPKPVSKPASTSTSPKTKKSAEVAVNPGSALSITNGTSSKKSAATRESLACPGPPPPPPTVGHNGTRLISNGGGPTLFQWHQYQPSPQQYSHANSQPVEAGHAPPTQQSPYHRVGQQFAPGSASSPPSGSFHSPHKRPVSSGYQASPAANGNHPATAALPPMGNFTTPANQRGQPTQQLPGQLPQNIAPGYSPTKQPSPKMTQTPISSSPTLVSAANHLSPSKAAIPAASGHSPIKSASAPVSLPASLGVPAEALALQPSSAAQRFPPADPTQHVSVPLSTSVVDGDTVDGARAVAPEIHTASTTDSGRQRELDGRHDAISETANQPAHGIPNPTQNAPNLGVPTQQIPTVAPPAMGNGK